MNVPKITPADYPDLLAAVDAGTPQRELARRYGCAPSLVARHVARAKRARGRESGRRPQLDLTGESHEGSTREILEERIHDPKTSARDLASLVNALARLDAEQTGGSDDGLRMQLAAAKRRIRELEIAHFQFPRFMPGVDEWLAGLPPEVEEWSALPGAPVELLDKSGRAHTLLPEDVRFFVEHLGWTTPPVFEPEEDLIEEWRATIAEYDARRAEPEPELQDRPHAGASVS